MTKQITVLAPIKLGKGVTEDDLIKASNKFQAEFAGLQPGLVRRELIRTGEGEYLDIIQFRSKEDAEIIIEKEKESPACHEFFAVMDMSEELSGDAGGIPLYQSLATYN
ncbi:MAG: hypothetical protein GXP17_05115 [Gammaproteobacteria bacterium]|nr:hypothetical protein [Gammaproteobacteria bacterium]